MRPPRILTNQLGRTLAELRAQAGLTQKQLAAAARLDPSSVSRMELGTRESTRETLEALADAMNLVPYDRRRLLHAGGFLVADAEDQERVDTIATLLTDPRVPAAYATAVRAQMDAMTNQLRIIIARPVKGHLIAFPDRTEQLPGTLTHV